MGEKNTRLEAIYNIIQTEEISSQQELIDRLQDMNLPTTQGSLSRYIRELNIVKHYDDEGKRRYRPANDVHKTAEQDKLCNELEFSGNLAVIRTKPGYAMGIASDIDAENCDEILATVAGDDAILVIPREGFDRESITEVLKRFI